MKKCVFATASLLLAVVFTFESAHAAQDAGCEKVLEAVPAQISNIHEFIKKVPELTEIEYVHQLAELNEVTNKLADQFSGCNAFTDNLTSQMQNAVTDLLVNSDKYRGI